MCALRGPRITHGDYAYNNNNKHDDIYSAVIVTEVIARVHSRFIW